MYPTLTRLYAVSVNSTRRQFSRGELAMCIDVSNAVFLGSMSAAESLVMDVADTFADMPGEYEQKWGIDKAVLLAKLRALDPWQIACLQIWGNAYRYDHVSDLPDPDLDLYIKTPLWPESEIVRQVDVLLNAALEFMRKVKGAFKSALVAEAVKKCEQARDMLTGKVRAESPAAALGRKGGLVKSERKAASSRENGKKGGRAKQGKQ